jgi:hypothetical protein
MLWMALRWNLGNTLPFAAFCLLSIIAIGGGWPGPAGVRPAPGSQSSTLAALPNDPPEPGLAIALIVR